jgi:hypothetical protein
MMPLLVREAWESRVSWEFQPLRALSAERVSHGTIVWAGSAVQRAHKRRAQRAFREWIVRRRNWAKTSTAASILREHERA